jgi:hypothetical protein
MKKPHFEHNYADTKIIHAVPSGFKVSPIVTKYFCSALPQSPALNLLLLQPLITKTVSSYPNFLREMTVLLWITLVTFYRISSLHLCMTATSVLGEPAASIFRVGE